MEETCCRGSRGQRAKADDAVIRGRWSAAVALWTLAVAGVLDAAEGLPVMVQSAPGRFEVAAVDPSAAHAVAAMAEECWRHLEGPLALPAAFSSPVFVRLIRTTEAPAEVPVYRVNVEAGGVVSVWIASDAGGERLRRALVHGLIARLAVAWHGVGAQPTVPLWLQHAGVGWWQSRTDGAALDALKQRCAQLRPPPIAGILDWTAGAAEPPEFRDAAVWLLTFLQQESGRGGEWGTLLRRLLAGADPQAALAQAYPGRFFGPPARELWWQTGWHHLRRMRSLPALESAESGLLLAHLSRFVLAGADGEADRVVSLREVLAHADEPFLQAELARRAAELGRALSSLHPFYRNAGLSLAEAFGPGARDAAKIESQCVAFEEDWRDATELETAARAALDALEKRTTAPRGPESG